MDESLVQRWREGEHTATTAIRNGVRSVAERVLSHPALKSALPPGAGVRLSNEERRREVTAEVADEVMRRGAANANQLKAMSIMVSGKVAVTALQQGRPSVEGAHVPPQVAMTLALAPDGVSSRIREAAERHLQICPHCREDIRIMERIVATLDAVDHETSREQIAQEAASAQSVLDAPIDLAAAARSTARDLERSSRQRRGRGKGTRAGGRMLPEPDPEPRRIPPVIPLIVVLGLAGAVIWWWQDRATAPVGTTKLKGLATLADRAPPEVGRLADLPPEVQFVVADFGNGDCRTASGRLRTLEQQHPAEPRLVALEGAALVCAGDGRRALQAFERLDEMVAGGARRPPASHWHKAQAHLLMGNVEPALDALRLVEVQDGRRRARATALTATINEMVAAE